MSTPFEAQALERRYAFLDALPAIHFDAIVTMKGGILPDRVEGLVRWRNALLGGTIPGPGGWPPEAVAGPIRRALEELGIARFCRDQPALADALLADVLSAIAGRMDRLEAEVAARLRELEELERVRLENERKPRAKRVDREQLELQARREVEGAPQPPDESIAAAWGERVRAWSAIEEVFGDLGELLGRGWDLTAGVLRRTGWSDLLRLRALVEKLPQLREVVQSLGRLQDSTKEESIADRIFVQVQRIVEERREVRTPRAPTETRGIERSGEIARMLPGEAALFGHPKLRLLWHARRAERTLLTYRLEGLAIERALVEREEREERERRRPRPERGPILAVIDTSGSMQGIPEQVAKALVLEALRTAHAERRRCFVYDFSGPGQLRELELSVDERGLSDLIEFLGASFGGGSDPSAALTGVLGKISKEEWKRADVLVVSDGEWPAPAGVLPQIGAAREEGTRFHGVQVGNRGRTGLHAVCDPVHVFADWASIAGWRH